MIIEGSLDAPFFYLTFTFINSIVILTKIICKEVFCMSEPKVIKCEECNKKVELLSSWANQCSCGTEYNGFGQRLADRSQWGYETGETF